eukprot:7007625-Prymnesium_polylepis.1
MATTLQSRAALGYRATSSPSRTAVRCVTCTSGAIVSSITFYFHLYGSTMGNLYVKDAAGSAVWSKDGNLGISWRTASVLVSSPSFRHVCSWEQLLW